MRFAVMAPSDWQDRACTIVEDKPMWRQHRVVV